MSAGQELPLLQLLRVSTKRVSGSDTDEGIPPHVKRSSVLLRTVLLAGGFSTRLSEETASWPKPIVEMGGRPMLWHTMSLYVKSGFREFVVACGYKGDIIKAYFQHVAHAHSDWIINISNGTLIRYGEAPPDRRAHCSDTGYETLTGDRLRPLLKDATFLCTYGDGLGGVPIEDVLAFHRRHDCLAADTDQVMRGGMLLACHPGLTEPQLQHIHPTFRRFAAGRR